jgi:hypothetical protein
MNGQETSTAKTAVAHEFLIHDSKRMRRRGEAPDSHGETQRLQNRTSTIHWRHFFCESCRFHHQMPVVL